MAQARQRKNNKFKVMADVSLRVQPDPVLVENMKTGCQESFEVLIERYSSKAFSMANRLTRSQQDAEEVLQDVFVTVFRKIQRFEGKSSFSSWLYRITFNAALMKLRKRRRTQLILLDDIQIPGGMEMQLVARESEQGDSITLRHELARALSEAISELPDEYRPVYVLRDIDGLSTREVGRMLRVSVPAIKSRLHRARLMLRRRLLRLYREMSPGIREVGNG